MVSEEDGHFAGEGQRSSMRSVASLEGAEIGAYVQPSRIYEVPRNPQPHLNTDDLDDEIEHDPWPQNPVLGAEELLRW